MAGVQRTVVFCPYWFSLYPMSVLTSLHSFCSLGICYERTCSERRRPLQSWRESLNSVPSVLFHSFVYNFYFPSSLHVFEVLGCWFLPLADLRAILLNWRNRRQFEPKLPRRARNTERCLWDESWIEKIAWQMDDVRILHDSAFFFCKKLNWTDAHAVVCCLELLCSLRGSFLFVCRAIAATDLEEMAAVGFQGDSEAKYRRYTITMTRKCKHVENVEHVLGGVLMSFAGPVCWVHL